ncbi:MAG: fatty acid--CoA ligase [Pseudomonadota bacterium]
MLQGTRIIARADNAYQYPLLIKRLLDMPSVCALNQEIIYRNTRRFTYAQFLGRARQLASGLSSMGIQPGDTVAFMDWDSYRYLEAYFAVPGIGAVLHTVNVRLSPEQIRFTMNHAEDTVVFVHQDFIPIVEAIREKVPSVKKWILIREPGEPEPAHSMHFDAEYEEVLVRGTMEFEFPDMDENSQATVSYTTGTTGDPKGVYFSHRQLVLHTLAVGMALGNIDPVGKFRAGDVYMPITPMFHVHAWGLPYLATLMGVKQVYPGRYEPAMILKLREDHKVSFSHCVPTILQMLLSAPEAKQTDLSGWKMVIGGAAFTKGLCKQAMDLGMDVFTGYGMSETCPILTISLLKPEMLKLDPSAQVDIRIKTGIAVPLVELKVMDIDMNPVPMDNSTSGEICVRSPWCTQGYFKGPEQGKTLWHGGYLHTGDVAVRDAAGYVRITDRLKDVIKTGGEWISSLEIENLISQHPAVREAAVVGVPDAKWGERPLAMVVVDGDSRIGPDDIKAFLMKFVADGVIEKWALPERILITEAIPKTSVGKIDKKVIRVNVQSNG